jgi:hypothetical protein
LCSSFGDLLLPSPFFFFFLSSFSLPLFLSSPSLCGGLGKGKDPGRDVRIGGNGGAVEKMMW